LEEAVLLAASVISLGTHDSFPVILILLFFEQRCQSPIKMVNINGVGGRTMMA
jgi:hypothetical protein